MNDSVLLAFFLGILTFDAIFVVLTRGSAKMASTLFRTVMAASLFVVSLFTPMTTMQAFWYAMTAVVFLYNTWFRYATDDDLCESGAIGRWILNRQLSVLTKLEKLEKKTA